MELKQAFIAELQHEAANTRKILGEVDMTRQDYKPHEKSMPLGKLAVHVADLPGWVSFTLEADELDLSKMHYVAPTFTTNEELIAHLDANINKAIASLEKTNPEDFFKMWTLRQGDHVIFTMPKAAVVRSMALSHLYHHRGQLSVYVRMTDSFVPGMYGPSKDDQLAQKAAMEAAN